MANSAEQGSGREDVRQAEIEELKNRKVNLKKRTIKDIIDPVTGEYRFDWYTGMSRAPNRKPAKRSDGAGTSIAKAAPARVPSHQSHFPSESPDEGLHGQFQEAEIQIPLLNFREVMSREADEDPIRPGHGNQQKKRRHRTRTDQSPPQGTSLAGDAISIDSLPESLLLHIFISLDQVIDRCSVARTCHSWNRIIRDSVLWKDYAFQETKLDHRNVRATISAGLSSLLLDLDVTVSSGNFRSFLYRPQLWMSLANLEKLRVGSIDLCAFDFKVLPASLRSLTLYTMDHFDTPSPARIKCSSPVLPNLTSLEIEDCEDVFANDVVRELHGLHFLLTSEKLKTVSLKLMHFLFTPKSLGAMSAHLRYVEDVCLQFNSICDEGFAALVAPLERVRVLNLQFANIEADMEDLVKSISRLKTLRCICLSMFWELRPQNIRAMVLSLPELETVRIHRCRRIKKDDLNEIEKLRDGLKCSFPRYMTLSFY